MLLGTEQPQKLPGNSCHKLSSDGLLLSLGKGKCPWGFKEEEGVAEKLTGPLDSSPKLPQY